LLEEVIDQEDWDHGNENLGGPGGAVGDDLEQAFPVMAELGNPDIGDLRRSFNVCLPDWLPRLDNPQAIVAAGTIQEELRPVLRLRRVGSEEIVFSIFFSVDSF
jgi:hypothetical protein